MRAGKTKKSARTSAFPPYCRVRRASAGNTDPNGSARNGAGRKNTFRIQPDPPENRVDRRQDPPENRSVGKQIRQDPAENRTRPETGSAHSDGIHSKGK